MSGSQSRLKGIRVCKVSFTDHLIYIGGQVSSHRTKSRKQSLTTMPTKKTTQKRKSPTPSTKRKKGEKVMPAKNGQWQPELFTPSAGAGEQPTIEFSMRIPSGTSISFTAPGETPSVPANPSGTSHAKMLEILGNLPKEDLRTAMRGLSYDKLNNLCTTLHGRLYHLAAIGGKVTQRRA